MTADPLVSIILPTYNRAWALPVAVNSALAQTYGNIEVIVTDNASTDDTRAVVTAFSDSRIRYHRQESNVGPVRNYEAGLRLASGEYVVFLADDDELDPDFVENRLMHLRGDSDLVVAFSSYKVRQRDGTSTAVTSNSLHGQVHLDAYGLLRAALSGDWWIGAAMYRRRAVVALWDMASPDDHVVDLALNIRLATRAMGDGMYLPEPDVTALAHSGQDSRMGVDLVFLQTKDALERVLAEQLPAHLSSLIRRKLASWHVVWARHLYSQHADDEARIHFANAVRTDPRLLWAWKQLALSYCPRPLVGKRLIP